MKAGRFKISQDGREVIIEEIRPHVAIRLKNVFPSIKKSRRPPIKLTLTPDVAEDFEWFLKRYPMDSSRPDLGCVLAQAEASRIRYERIEQMVSGLIQSPVKLAGGDLRDYQARAVHALREGKHLLLGDDVGLGKTFVALGAWTDPRTRPALVVVQSHLVRQWLSHVISRLGLIAREIKTTNPKKEILKPADVYVTTYHRLAGWVDPLCSGMIKSVTFDEAQELRRSQSQRYDAAKAISSAVEYKLALTATPVYNYGIEIFNVVDCIAQGVLGTEEEFIREWCKNDYSGQVKDPDALGAYLRERHILLRRTRAEVGRELPPINRIVHEIPYDEAEQNKVLDVALALARKTLTGSFTERGQAAREFDIMLRMATGMAKAKYVAEYVKILLENGEKVLLAGWHRDVYEVWLRELKAFNPVMYTGSESAKQKDESKRKMVSGESNLMIISLRSGVGLDGLQEVCNIVVVGELDWSPEIYTQLFGRVRRDGQENQVTGIFLVCDGGSDPPMVELNGLKSEQARGIMDPNAGAQIRQSDTGRIKEMARRFLEKRGVNIKEDKSEEIQTLGEL